MNESAAAVQDVPVSRQARDDAKRDLRRDNRRSYAQATARATGVLFNRAGLAGRDSRWAWNEYVEKTPQTNAQTIRNANYEPRIVLTAEQVIGLDIGPVTGPGVSRKAA